MNHWTPPYVEESALRQHVLQVHTYKMIFEAPQSLVPDTIQCICCLAMQMIASAFFVNQAFEASELQKTLIAFT